MAEQNIYYLAWPARGLCGTADYRTGDFMTIFQTELGNILRNALLVIPKEQELITLTLIPHMLLVYNVFGGNTHFVRTKPKYNKGDYLFKMNCLYGAKHSPAIFILQTSRSRSTSEMEKIL